MDRIITSEILVAYSQCRRKAYLILCSNEKGIQYPEYIRILELRQLANQKKHINILQQKNPNVQCYSLDNLHQGGEILVNALLKTDGLEANCAILTKVVNSSSLGGYGYEPTIFSGTYSPSREQRLELLFISFVLEHLQHQLPKVGRIIELGGRPHKVALDDSHKAIIPLLEPLQEWATISSPEPPPVILNKHCPYCQFQNSCQTKAEQEDNLSLLDGITSKIIRGYEKKGIFTVTQLSYLAKPRKHKKHTKNPPPTIHKFPFQALAIKTGKIYVQELPELTRQSIELFLDIEGIPDQQFCYLIGLLICDSNTNASTYYCFWADTHQDEAQMWQQFLEKVSQYPDAPIYHYGSYEPRSITRLAKQYNTDIENLKNRLVNVNRYIYGKIYFPVRSNGLKKIGNFIGTTWTFPNVSGLQALVWRHYWDETHHIQYQDLLLTYNQEDCQALKLLTDELSKIKDSVDLVSDSDILHNQPKRRSIKSDNPIHHQLEAILRFSYSNYDKKKISFQQMVDNKENKHLKPKTREPRQKIIRKLTTTIRLPQREKCPKCDNELLVESKKTTENVVIDLVFTENGLEKTITRYWAVKGHCRKCNHYYNPPNFNVHGCPPLYGYGFKVWIAYQRVALRSSYEIIEQTIEDVFDEKIDAKLLINYIRDVALHHSETEKKLIHCMLKSPFIHADETKINIGGVNWYVWVFTDGKHVVFRLTESRDATIVHELLSGYSGILVSDFYAGYDSVKCGGQQKCWVHLIRDLNNDLWGAPFDTEFESFVLEVKNLIVPILATIDKNGSQARNLSGFKENVEQFYKKSIDHVYKSDLTRRYQKRFLRYRDSLFTFLEKDGIPWHNNTAESAIRHLALQRKISEVFRESAMYNYLVLLGIKQTCRFQNKSFLKFLFSGETDIDKYEEKRA